MLSIYFTINLPGPEEEIHMDPVQISDDSASMASPDRWIFREGRIEEDDLMLAVRENGSDRGI